MDFLFIINPKSGLKLNKLVEKKIVNYFSKTEHRYFIEYTKYPGNAKEIVIKYSQKGFKNFIAVGGDGTIREIATFLVGKDLNLGVIPCGSGNGFARNLLIPLDIDDAIKRIINAKITKVDVGICNSNIFLVTAGVGFDAHIAYLFNNTYHFRGLFFYFFYGFLSYFKYKPKKFKIYFDGREIFALPFLLTIANGKQYGGGAIVSPLSIVNDGILEMVVVDNVSFLKILFKINYLFNGKINEVDFVKTYKSSNFKIVFDGKLIYHLDGDDFVSDDGVLNISVLKESLNVIV